MAYNYTRQSTFSTGDVITAALFNNEYNALLNAFKYSSTNEEATGHRHDGSTNEGGSIYVIGDMDFNNKIVADSANNRWGVFVEVASAPVEQIRFQDGAIVPVTTNDIDLGTASLKFKDVYVEGTTYWGSLSDGTIAITGWADEDTMSSNSATLVPTQQSVKAYVDAQVTAQDLDFIADSGGALNIDLDSETLSLLGGTGITSVGASNTVTFNIDSTVTTLTGTQELTNKTLTSPVVSGGSVDNAPIGAITPAAGTFTTLSLTGALTTSSTIDGRDVATDGAKLDLIEASADVTDATNVNAAGAVMNTDTTTAAMSFVVDEDNLASDLATKVPTQQSVKAYVDATITGAVQEADTSTGSMSFVVDEDDMNSNSATKLATQQSIKSYVDTLETAAVLNADTSTASMSFVLDEDDMSSNSATKLATQQSIKAYIDTLVIPDPTGAVHAVAYDASLVAPEGYLYCGGAAVSRTTYAGLFAVLGTAWGVGDGSTTFNLPDFRGRFLRGWDDSAGRDAARAIATYQTNANKSHTHTATSGNDTHNHTASSANDTHDHDIETSFFAGGTAPATGPYFGDAGYRATAGYTATDAIVSDTHNHTITVDNDEHNHTVTVDADGGTESRPENASVSYVIKY